MEIKILIDNRATEGGDLACEHGLSLYVESNSANFLVDTGASGAFLDNAARMGVDLSAVDFCIISHGHDDHTGGLRHFLELDSKAKVIVSSDLFTSRYFSTSRGEVREIGIERGLLDEYLDRFNCLDVRTEPKVGAPLEETHIWWVTPDIAIIRCQCDKYPRPGANSTLFKSGLEDGAKLLPDDFSHELSVAVKTSEGLVVISSCSHCGAANIIESSLESTGESRLAAFIGGLHFTDRSGSPEEDASEFLKYIGTCHPHAQIYTGHCTGDKAKDLLSQYKFVNFFRTGTEITLHS